MRRKITHSEVFNGHPLVKDTHGDGFNVSHLEIIGKCLDKALDKSSRILVIATELSTPVGYGDRSNEAFSNTMDYCTRKFSGYGWDTHYVATREESNGHQHYHVITTVDNSVVKSPYNIQQAYERKFAEQLGLPAGSHGCMDNCARDRNGNPQPNCHVVSRGDAKSYDEAFQRASYIAKVYSKPSSGKTIFHSL